MEKNEVMNQGATLIIRARRIEAFASNTVFLLFLAVPVMFLGFILGSIQRDLSLIYLGGGVFTFAIFLGVFSNFVGSYWVKRMRQKAVNLYDSIGIKISGR